MQKIMSVEVYKGFEIIFYSRPETPAITRTIKYEIPSLGMTGDGVWYLAARIEAQNRIDLYLKLNQTTMNKQLNTEIEQLKQEAKAIQDRIEKIESLMPESEVWIPEVGEPAMFYDRPDGRKAPGILIHYGDGRPFPFAVSHNERYLFCEPLPNYIYQKPNPNWTPSLNEVCVWEREAVQVVEIITQHRVKITSLTGDSATIHIVELSQLTLNSFKS